MITLDTLENTTRPYKRRKRVGRGPGSGRGKTCGRGEKGAGSRSGYKRRWGYEGGQMRLHMKLPKRGFSNVRFQKRLESVNLVTIEEHYTDGEEVTRETLWLKRLIRGDGYGLKILGEGTLTKKVVIVADAISDSAKEKLEANKIEFRLSDTL